jgi:type II secretory pathway component GspD/PulD (secretin)
MLRPLVIACLALSAAVAEEVPAVTPPPAPLPPVREPVTLSSPEVVERAGGMVISGRRAEAIALLEDHLKRNPDDAAAMQTLLAIRIGELEEEIRAILARDAETRELAKAPTLDYAAIKARSKEVVQRRLEVADYFDARGKPGDAIEACDAILKDHVGDPAALTKKLGLLKQLRAKLVAERGALENESEVRAIAAINEVIEHSIMPQEKAKDLRTVVIFDEDVAAVEREKVRARLHERVSLENMTGVEVRKVIETLFAIAGINYVILDSAIGTETLTLNVVDESLENILAIVSRQVQLRYNYIAGTVYISSSTSNVLETEIIRLQSGLTDVMAKPQMQQQAAQSGAGGAGGGANGNPLAALDQQNQQQEQKSDLEKFLEKVPDIVVGWPAEGTVYLDRKSNSVFIRSTPAGITEVKRLLQALDFNTVQVLIEARFVLVSESAGFDLGVDWQGRTQDTVNGRNVSGEGRTNFGTGPIPAPIGTSTPKGLVVSGLLGDLTGQHLGATLRALESKGKAQSLAEPKIMTLNNGTGMLSLENDITYIDSYTTQNQSTEAQAGNNGNIVTTQTVVLQPQLKTEKEEISLMIIPSVARNSDVITLHLLPRVRQLTRLRDDVSFQYQPSPGAAVINNKLERPEFEDRKLETTLHVQNGQTIALGGLVSGREQQSTNGVPFISRIPILGNLFRTDSKSTNRSNLVIFVTAYLIDPNGAKVGDDVRLLRDNAHVALPPAVREEVMRRSQEEADGKGAAGAPGWQKGKGK